MFLRIKKYDIRSPLNEALEKIYSYQNELTNSQNNLKQLCNQVAYYDKQNKKTLLLAQALSLVSCGFVLAAFINLNNYIFIYENEETPLNPLGLGFMGLMIALGGLLCSTKVSDYFFSQKRQNEIAYEQAKTESKKLNDATDDPQAMAVVDPLYDSYISSYRKTAEMLEGLMERFDQLTPDQQLQLVELKLAEIDDAQRIFLKNVCPISKSFIVQPYAVIVEGKTRRGDTVERQDRYDYHTFSRLNDTNISPLSPGWTIKSVEFSKKLNQQHLNYFIALEQEITKLEKKLTLMPMRH